MTTKALYQRLYDDPTLSYGVACANRCPGVRLFEHYRRWLHGRIIDLGCGTGDTVEALRKAGFDVDGIDQIILDNGMLTGDITTKITLTQYNTAICIDVFEHILDEPLARLMENMAQVKYQIISIHNAATFENLNEDLHVNKKQFSEWIAILSQRFDVMEDIAIHENQHLYLCERKS